MQMFLAAAEQNIGIVYKDGFDTFVTLIGYATRSPSKKHCLLGKVSGSFFYETK